MQYKKICVVLLAILSLLFGSTYVKAEKSKKITIDDITAPSAILVDADSGKVLYERNSREKRMCASITKVMTLLLAFEEIDSGRMKLSDEVIVSDHAASMTGSTVFLKSGDHISLEEIIKSVVVASANDAAVALAEHISGSEEKFVGQMNEKAQKLNMTDTIFKNCNGLDEEGHLTSAYDISIMSCELTKHEKVFTYTGIWMDNIKDGKTQLVNTNKLLKKYKGITGLKTGTTDGAGCCMVATAKRHDVSLLSVVLGCKESDDRFSESAAILDYGFENFTYVPLKFDKSVLQPLKVVEGMVSEVGLDSVVPSKVLLNRAKVQKIKTKVEIDESICAPVKKGQIVGKVMYILGDEIIDEGDIFAVDEVERMSFLKVFVIFMKSLMKV